MITAAASKSLATSLNRPVGSRRFGLLIALGASVLILLLTLPLLDWISISNASKVAKSLGIEGNKLSKVGAKTHYSVLLFLDFVQKTKAGLLGFPAALLLMACVASLVLNVMFIIKLIINKPNKKGYLGVFVNAKGAYILTIISALGTFAYCMYANHTVEALKKKTTIGNAFRPTWVVIVVLVIAILAYVLIKIMEAQERKLYHEHGLLREIKKNWILFIFLIPCFVYFLINNYLPMSGIYFAFTQFNFRDGLFSSPFIGMKNFEYLVRADLWKLTRNTILYNIVFITLGNSLQIFFAILVSQCGVKWFKRVSQTLLLMPHFVSYVILKVLVYNILEYDIGVINSAIAASGGTRIDFYNTPAYWPFLITFFNLWKGLGYGTVVYLATIMGISDEYYEAAKIDGANIFQQIRYITLPLLKPTFIILLLYAIGGIFKGQFELFWQMVGNNGMLFNVTDILDTYVYRVTISQPMNMGLSTAAGLYQSVFGLIVVVVTNAIIKHNNAEYALF